MASTTTTNPNSGARLEARAGSALALRLRIRNRMMAAALLRPVVDDWVTHDGQILHAGARSDPAYVYLLQGGEARQTITLLVPSHLPTDSVLTTSLRFPGLGDETVPIELRILPPAETGRPEPPLDVPLELVLPFGDQPASPGGDFGTSAQASYSLVAGLAGLDMIPARWLVAELVAAVSQFGSAQAGTEAGTALLDRLGRTRFFKNGVIAFASAQVPRWILSGLAATSGLNAALGGQSGQGDLLYIWERWLLGLADGDIADVVGAAAVRVPHSTLQTFAARAGTGADLWFGHLLLGLAALSPRIAVVLETIAARAPGAPDDGAPPSPPADDVLGESGTISR